MKEKSANESVKKTWLVILICVGVILLQGFLAFFVVGNKGQPDWDYRSVKDVPGESPYAIYEKLPHGQHVRGAKGE